MKFTFLLSSTAHVRFLKRVDLIRKNGIDVKVFAFERKNSYPGRNTNFEIRQLSSITHQSYLKRLVLIFKAVNKIKNECKKTDVIYTFGLDMLFLGWLSKLFCKNRNIKLVYEVGDIREILLGNSISNKLARSFEKFLLRKIRLLVVTSEAFFTQYFVKLQKAEKVNYFVIENKLDPELIQNLKVIHNYETEQSDLTIGYFGVLRCERTWEILKKLVQKANGSIKIYVRGVAGVSTSQFLEEIKNNPYFIYEGPYVVPEDLNELYNSVDIVWACYPYQGEQEGNWKWAKTIRFYESCYFKKPMFAQKGTEDCKTVKHFGIGTCLNLSNIQETVDYLLKINRKQIADWRINFDKLPQSVYVHTNEHKRLIDKLQKL